MRLHQDKGRNDLSVSPFNLATVRRRSYTHKKSVLQEALNHFWTLETADLLTGCPNRASSQSILLPVYVNIPQTNSLKDQINRILISVCIFWGESSTVFCTCLTTMSICGLLNLSLFPVLLNGGCGSEWNAKDRDPWYSRACDNALLSDSDVQNMEKKCRWRLDALFYQDWSCTQYWHISQWIETSGHFTHSVLARDFQLNIPDNSIHELVRVVLEVPQLFVSIFRLKHLTAQ